MTDKKKMKDRQDDQGRTFIEGSVETISIKLSNKDKATIGLRTQEITTEEQKTKSLCLDEDQQKQRFEQQQERLHAVMWRDVFFLVLGGVALNVISYVETHAADADIRGGGWVSQSPTQIVDAGFVLTARIHTYLDQHRHVNDLLAFLNSLLLVLPSIYVAKVTVWNGDYTAAFRILMTQLFRSFCGWFTYLPPDSEFLMSYYDFPEVAQCLFQDCSSKDPSQQVVLPFVSFFSGHVATVVIVANHMYVNHYVKCCLALHVLNVLQIVRLLATRGHYSIDIIIGWCVAVYVSNPAERLGRYYSKGMSLTDMLPKDAKSAFETVTGVCDVKNQSCVSMLHSRYGSSTNDNSGPNNISNEEDTLKLSYSYEVVQSDTTARVVAEMAADFAARHQDTMLEDLTRLGLQMSSIRELGIQDLMRLLTLAELKMSELRQEATRMGVPWTEAATQSDILSGFVRRAKEMVQETIQRHTFVDSSDDSKLK